MPRPLPCPTPPSPTGSFSPLLIGNPSCPFSDGSPLTTGGMTKEKGRYTLTILQAFSDRCGSHFYNSSPPVFLFPYCLTFSAFFSLITSISNLILTSSPTSMPPLSNNLLNFMPKSFRLMVPSAVKPARVLPQGS